MTTNDYNNLLLLLQTQINDLALNLNGTQVTTVIRKLPVIQEEDPVPLICISPAGPESYKKVSAGHYFVTWKTQVNIIAANNGDENTNLSTYLLWRQQIAALIEAGFTYANLLRTDLESETAISPFEIPSNYDYVPLVLSFILYY